MLEKLKSLRLLALWGGMTTLALVATETKPDQTPPIESYHVVYPYAALLAQKRGKVEADFIVDRQGHLVSVTIAKSDAPEFAAAVLAYADATDFSLLAKGAAAEPKTKDQPLLALRQTIEFDERVSAKVVYSISTPTPAALAVLKSLRLDPSGKEFGGARGLDTPLQIVVHQTPAFPRELQDRLGEGAAVVEFFVGQDGQVMLPRVVSATEPAFGYSACQSVLGWKFTPPVRGGKATVVRAQIPIKYSLNKAPTR